MTSLKIFESKSDKQEIDSGIEKLNKLAILGANAKKATELITEIMKIKKENLELTGSWNEWHNIPFHVPFLVFLR